MSVQERIKRYKSTGGAAGLVRVEVLVPSEDRAHILAMAAELRARHRALEPAPKAPGVNRETVNDRAKLILHRLVAGHLRRSDQLLVEARQRFKAMPQPVPDYVRDWLEILDQPVGVVARLIVKRSDALTRLRTASPFQLSAAYDDPAWRRRVWQKAKLGVAR